MLFCWFCFVLVGFASVWGVVRCSWFSASAVVYCICVVSCLGCFGVVRCFVVFVLTSVLCLLVFGLVAWVYALLLRCFVDCFA